MNVKSLIAGLISLCCLTVHAGLPEGVQAYERRDYPRALQEFTPLAQAGDPRAQHALSVMYANGLGVSKNVQEAAFWAQKAALQNYPNAQHQLGVMYANGLGVAKNDQEAFSWWQKAAQQNHAEAQADLAIMFQRGRGVSQNIDQAVFWYQRAAQNGSVRAMTNLGQMYERGAGIQKNDKLALDFYQMAGDRGDALAQHNAGVMHQFGLGTRTNHDEAERWYRKAIANNPLATNSIINLSLIYDGIGDPVATMALMKWAVSIENRLQSPNVDVIRKLQTAIADGERRMSSTSLSESGNLLAALLKKDIHAALEEHNQRKVVNQVTNIMNRIAPQSSAQ